MQGERPKSFQKLFPDRFLLQQKQGGLTMVTVLDFSIGASFTFLLRGKILTWPKIPLQTRAWLSNPLFFIKIGKITLNPAHSPDAFAALLCPSPAPEHFPACIMHSCLQPPSQTSARPLQPNQKCLQSPCSEQPRLPQICVLKKLQSRCWKFPPLT